MRILAILLVAASAAFSSDAADPWLKVKELKSGTELRVYKKGSTAPLQASSAEVTDDMVIVVLKKEETAIPKGDIDRIDARPNVKRSVTKTTTSKTNEITMEPSATNPIPAPTQNNSYSSNVSMGSKPDFETVYRRSR